jgi:hypothetical protein
MWRILYFLPVTLILTRSRTGKHIIQGFVFIGYLHVIYRGLSKTLFILNNRFRCVSNVPYLEIWDVRFSY